MAKTTSQIIAENQVKRAEAAAVGAQLSKIHQQQMAQVGAKNAARTAAVLEKAIKDTTGSLQKKSLELAHSNVVRDAKKNKINISPSTPREEQIALKNAPETKKQTRDRTKKEYDDYVKSDEYKKRVTENDQRARAEAAAQMFQNPGQPMPQPKVIQDEQEMQLRAAMETAEQEYNAVEDNKVIEQDLEAITGLSNEERRALEQYAVNQIRDQNLPVEMVGVMPTAQQEASGLIDKYGKQRVDEMAETFMRQENAKLAQQSEETGREMAKEHPVLASAATVPINLAGSIVGAVGQLQGAARGTGRYSTLDANETGTALEKFSGAVRGQVAENIEGENPSLLRKGASTLYQGGMSFIDSTARILASGGSAGISSAIAAMGAFSQGLQKYSAMGASPEQAALAATASAGLEYITEKLPTDEVLRIFHKGGNASAVKEVLKQAFLTEPLGEEVNLFAGIAAEALILGEKSGKNQRIGDLIAGGMTKAEAETQFWKETFAEAAETYAVSAVAGGLGAGGAVIAGNQVQQAQEQRQTQTEDSAEPLQQEAQPLVPTEVELAQLAMDDTAAGLQETAPAAAPAAPVNDQQQNLQMAMEDLIGGQEQQEQTTNAVTNPIESYPPEKQSMIRSYIQAVDTKIKDFVQKVKGGDTSFKRQKIADVNDRAASDISRILGIDVNGFTHNINTNGIQHIINRHTGKPGGHDNSMELDDDIARVGWVLENYDNVELLVEDGEQVYSSEFRDKNDNPAPQIRFVKKIDGNYYVVEAACENKYNKLWVQSAYLQKNNGDVTQAPAEGPSANHETNARSALASPSPTDIVSENNPEVNGNSSATQLTKEETSDSNVNTSASSPQTGDNGNLPPVGGQETSVSNPDYRNSNTYMNTGLHSENANIRAGYRQELRRDPDAARYEVKHNADTLAEAQSRTGSPENNAAALQDLLSRDHWTAEDVATSTLLLDQIMASGDRDTIAKLNDLRQKRKAEGSRMGQEVQSFAINNPTMKAAESPATAVDTFRSSLDGMKQEETTYPRSSGKDFETWKQDIKDDVDRLGIAIATVEDGDSDSMRRIIRQIAGRRNTTAWFGTSDNLTGHAWSVLKKLDFEDLRKIANTQLASMADDYRARSAGEVAKGLRKQSMLSSLKTFVRNISGNGVGGFADAVSESGAGRLADLMLSRFTGKKTIGNDLARAGTYAKAAREAGQFASLCVELNIPIETDVDASFAAAAGNGSNPKYLGKTFRATGNPAMRALYAYQKYMSYALEVTDKIFEGGANAAVTESLNRLQGANLTDQDVEALGDFTANRRTFKNATWEEEGETKGSTMARNASGLQSKLGIFGEVAMPFVSTPMNVAQTGIDYTAGVAKGVGEMIGIIKDAKAGKTIPVERQRQAASDFGRGVTGAAMIGMFASAAAMGALKVSNSKNWDKEALAQAEGRSGAQINWSALQRGLNGDDAKWQSGDIISGMDFLEPFNTQMYLGAELAQADDFNLLTGAGATIKSVWQSLMDSPVMTGLADIEQTLNDISEAETPEDAMNVAAGYAGDVASSYVPQAVRQIAQNQDGYYRDTRGENALDSAINSFMAAIPGQPEKLPVKYSGLGEAQKRGSALETFLDPTATHEFRQNEVTTFLDELSGKVGEKANNIYPDRQAPLRFTYGDDWEVKLDGKMRETYQKTYGEKVNALYQSLMKNPDFQGFSDELKIKALEVAKGYATRYAKAAVSDYREVPAGSVDSLTKGIINQQVRSQFDSLFTALDTQRDYGYSTEGTAAKLEESFQAYQDLNRQTQKEILEQATSDTAKYLEVRQKGVTTKQFLNTTDKIAGMKVQPTYKAIRPAQEFAAIASMPGISDAAKDTLMKAYMEDYDPNVKGSETTELKYDYTRQKLDMSPGEFALGYDIYSHEKHVGGDGTADRTRERMVNELGIEMADAKQLYKLYGGSWKPWAK